MITKQNCFVFLLITGMSLPVFCVYGQSQQEANPVQVDTRTPQEINEAFRVKQVAMHSGSEKRRRDRIARQSAEKQLPEKRLYVADLKKRLLQLDEDSEEFKNLQIEIGHWEKRLAAMEKY